MLGRGGAAAAADGEPEGAPGGPPGGRPPAAAAGRDAGHNFNGDKIEVPAWNGSMAEWNNYRRKVAVWKQATTTHPTKRAAQLIMRLSATAWEATEAMSLDELAVDNGVDLLLAELERALQVGTVHLAANALDEHLYQLKRGSSEPVQTFVTRFRNLRTRLRGYDVIMPDTVDGFLFLRKLGISADQRQAVLSLAGG